MKQIDILDLKFILRPEQEGGAIISGESMSLDISCHVRLSDKRLKEFGLSEIIQICKKIKESMILQAEHFPHLNLHLVMSEEWEIYLERIDE